MTPARWLLALALLALALAWALGRLWESGAHHWSRVKADYERMKP